MTEPTTIFALAIGALFLVGMVIWRERHGSRSGSAAGVVNRG